MGLRDELQSDIAEAFNTDLADAITAFKCSKEVQSGDFDFETQTYPIVTVEQYAGWGKLDGNYEKYIVKPSDYEVSDQKAIVLASEVTGELQIGDMWQTRYGELKIISILPMSADVGFVVQLRKV
ncbi:glutamate 5-kinase [Acinetobacter guillouiae]|uniref:glutamate 5-kinase n=1 Tax=Acinetobacter guillouiae TaxID=106649 RepID=UPI002FD9DA29